MCDGRAIGEMAKIHAAQTLVAESPGVETDKKLEILK